MSLRGSALLPLIVVFCLAFIFIYLFVIPQGSYIHTVVEVGESSLQIEKCALKKLYPISILDPEDDVTSGDRYIILNVIFDQTELLETLIRENIGIGTCVLNTKTLPSNIQINTELIIQVQLYNLNKEMINQIGTSLIYK